MGVWRTNLHIPGVRGSLMPVEMGINQRVAVHEVDIISTTVNTTASHQLQFQPQPQPTVSCLNPRSLTRTYSKCVISLSSPRLSWLPPLSSSSPALVSHQLMAPSLATLPTASSRPPAPALPILPTPMRFKSSAPASPAMAALRVPFRRASPLTRR